MILIIYWLLH